MDERRIEITDDFMFGYVMRNENICASVIECLIPGIKISKVEFRDENWRAVQTEKSIKGELGTRSVRLDVYLDDGTTVFNVEMQTGNRQNLPKRSRFYGSRIDCDILGEGHDYNSLKPAYVIFICTFYPFGDGLCRYTFENTCKENGRSLGDGSYKLFFNTTGTKGELTPELKSLLEYFNKPKSFPKEERTNLIETIENTVEIANKSVDWRREYMTYAQAQWDAEQLGHMKGHQEGFQEGRLLERIELLYSLVLRGKFTFEEAAEEARMTESEFKSAVQKLISEGKLN